METTVTASAPLTEYTALALLGAELARERGPARKQMEEDISRLAVRLRSLLDADAAAVDSPGAHAAAFGAAASQHLDLNALSGPLRKPQAGRQFSPDRRRRIEETLLTLDGYLRESKRWPLFWLVHSCQPPPGVEGAGGRCRSSSLGVVDALAFCEQLLDSMTAVFRAVRTARLEIENSFQPQIHEERLQRFTWQFVSEEELKAVPAVVSWESADRIAAAPLSLLRQMMQSRLPVQFLIPVADEELGGPLPDLGMMAMCHREAMVAQCSLAQPDHLADCLRQMAESPRPALAIVSFPGEPLLALSHAFPLYCYNPARGQTWAERLEVWDTPLPEPLTPANAAALYAQYQRHFTGVAPPDWDSAQVELSAYLALPEAMQGSAVPYLSTRDAEGVEQRALVGRELVDLCRDRMDRWGTLLELARGGRSAAPANQLEPAQLASPGADALRKAKQDGARHAVETLVAALMGR